MQADLDLVTAVTARLHPATALLKLHHPAMEPHLPDLEEMEMANRDLTETEMDVETVTAMV